jgi:hypothetical protein
MGNLSSLRSVEMTEKIERRDDRRKIKKTAVIIQ